MAYSEKDKQKIFDDICDLIINGKSLRTALKNLNSINAVTFFEWLRENELKAKQYARATIERSDMLLEDILDIADETPALTNTKFGTAIDNADVQNRKLRVDARRWALSKLNPKKYGDKPEVDDKERDNEITITIIENGNKSNKKV